MGGISAVADEAAHCYMRKLFEMCHGFAILNFGGWVGVFSAVADEAIHSSHRCFVENRLGCRCQLGWQCQLAVAQRKGRAARFGMVLVEWGLA